MLAPNRANRIAARTRGRYGRIRPGAVAALWLGVVRGALAPPASVPRPGFVPGRNHLGGTGRPCRFGAGLLIALAAVASGVPTFAQSNTLVSNLTQTQHANALSLFAWDAVQGFETGAGCHTLTSVELRLRRGGAAAVVAVPDVKVMEGTKTGSGVTFAGQSITLTGEETEIASGATAEYTFTAPAGTTLKESTRYFVVAEAPGPIAEWATTALPGEDAGGATGWFIDDKRWRRAANSAGSFTQRNRVQMLRVNGSTSNRAAPASAQDEDEIVHGRVLMDTTLTLGTYDEATAFAAADHWGYIDPTACGFAAGTAGSLGDADFVWRGVEYTVVALAVKGTSSVVLDIEDAAGTDLPATASIGVELTSGGGDAYLVPWPQYSTGHSDLIGRPELAFGDWRRTAAGTRLAVRILDLEAPDLWKADLEFTAAGSFATAYGYGNLPGRKDRDDGTSDGPGTLQPTTFEFAGVAYTVDRLLVRTPSRAPDVDLRFGTTPDLPRRAGYRLALPMTRRGQGIVYQYVLDGDYRPPRSESPAVGDYIWNVDTVINAEASGFDYPAGTRKVYLTRSPGDTESARPFWSATLTPGLGVDEFAGYKSTGFSYRGLNEKGGTLSSDEVGFEGVDYTVEAILFHTGGDTEGVYRTLTVATSAQLPEEKGIGLEVAYDSRTVVYWIDTADTSRAEGDEGAHLYEWDDIPSDHGWGSGGARSVSLLVPPPPGGMVHPRVLLDALLTVGTYADDNDPDESVWGFVDAGVTGFTAGTAGHVADAAFVYGGIEYGIRLLGVYGTATTVTQVLIAFEDAAGVALPADAAVGVELATGGGETVLVDWRLWGADDAAGDRLAAAAAAALDWNGIAAGGMVAVRILNLDAPDVLSGALYAGSLQGAGQAGRYAGIGTVGTPARTGDGTLRPTAQFDFEGTSYGVDVLGVAAADGAAELVFGTTPDLPSTAAPRLAVPRQASAETDHDGLVRYFRVDAGTAGTDTGAGDHWSWNAGWSASPGEVANRELPVYLTLAPGDTPSAATFWRSTLTPVRLDDAGIGFNAAVFGEIPVGGSLSNATANLGGLSYSVGMVAFATTDATTRDLVLATDPALPKAGGIGVALAYEVGGDRVFWIDEAEQDGDVYRWPEVEGTKYHGWDIDSDDDGFKDTRAVRLVQAAPLGPYAPRLLSVEVSADGRSVTLVYAGDLDAASTPAAAAFAVRADGAAVAVTGVAVNGRMVVLMLGRSVLPGETVTVGYDGGATPALRGGGNLTARSFRRSADNGSTAVGLANPHPRVLLDTTLTLGEYNPNSSNQHDPGYYAPDSPSLTGTVEAGALGDDDFVYDGVEYRIISLVLTGARRTTLVSTGVQFDFRDSGDDKLSRTKNVGVELNTGTGTTFVSAWPRFRANDEFLRSTLSDWAGLAAGTKLPVRILDLDAPDLWNANIGFASTVQSGAEQFIGYGGPATGTLSATALPLDGVTYTVDRLTLVTRRSGIRLQFSSTPDLPAGVALGVPQRVDATAGNGLVFHHPVAPGHAKVGDADVDFEWAWAGGSELGGKTAPVYLTRAPGETLRSEKPEELWSAQVTPGLDKGLLAYRRASATIPDLTASLAGLGTLEPDTAITVDGTTYTVNAVGFLSIGNEESAATVSTWPGFVLSTDPALPKGRGLGLAAGRAEGAMQVQWIDAADTKSYGYAWDLDGDNAHGWNTQVDSAYRSWPVRLVRVPRRTTPRTPVVRLSVSRDMLDEGAGTARVPVTAAFDLGVRDVPTVVTVTTGAPGDTASAADYRAAPLALTIPAGASNATGTLVVTLVDDLVTEDPEVFTVTGSAAGLEVDGAAVTIARNDHGVYLDTTMTAAESTADPPSVGFEAPSLGSVAEDRFGCCVESGEREFSLTGVSYQGADDALQLAVGLSAGAGVRVTNLVRDLVLESGASAVPLDAWDAAGNGSVLEFDLDTLAEHGFAQRFEDGETYPVRILGPWHPQVADVSVISTPESTITTGTVYGRGDPVRFRVDYDEPVTVTGSPTLRFVVRNIDATPVVETEATATYMAEESTPTGLVFGYTVASVATLSGPIVLLDDTDDTDAAARVQSPLSGGTIEAVLARPTATASRFMPAGDVLYGQPIYGAGTSTPPTNATVKRGESGPGVGSRRHARVPRTPEPRADLGLRGELRGDRHGDRQRGLHRRDVGHADDRHRGRRRPGGADADGRRHGRRGRDGGRDAVESRRRGRAWQRRDRRGGRHRGQRRDDGDAQPRRRSPRACRATTCSSSRRPRRTAAPCTRRRRTWRRTPPGS